MKKTIILASLLWLFCGIHATAQSACDFFTVQVEAFSGSARFDTISAAFLFCPEGVGEESFRASASYDSDTIDFNPSELLYTWYYDGNTYHGQEFTLSLDDPGAYPFRLMVEDPMNGCELSLLLGARVGTIPSFDGTEVSEEEVCARDFFTLRGAANPLTWTGFQSAVVETAPIPEEAIDPYESYLEFDIFGEDMLIDTVFDIDRICLSLDHVEFGHVRIELQCPDGAVVLLKDYSDGGANLGEPVIWDSTTPGKGYQYCFSPLPQYGTMQQTTPFFHAYSDNAGNYYFNAAYLPAGSYTPDQGLQVLNGCPMNGRWTIRVSDNLLGENGYIHSWSLFFQESYYPDSLIFTPEIVREQWYRDNTAISGNPAQVSEEKEGEYTYRFEAEDNFGCRYDTLVSVRVLALPEAEIVSDLEMPLCEGDSTYLRVFPLTGTDFDWVYQWMLGATDLPGRIFDTIMAKEPATYAVMVMDTLTGCRDVFNFAFDDQNCELVIPNVFTPNADGINDVFEIENLEHYPMAQVVIFNRWGKKVFEHPDYYNNWWDGQNSPDGVYFYVLRYERMGRIRYAEGAVTIIR